MKKIGEILIENGFLTKTQLKAALDIQERDDKGLLGVILLELKYITPAQLMKCLEIQNNLNKDD